VVEEGSPAPDFEAINHLGGKVRLSDYKGRIIVLYFYPKAMTPGCTREGIRFNELYEEFSKRGAVILGVSMDSPEVNKKFAEKHGFRFTLLSDGNGDIARAYGVLKGPSVERVTFIIDQEGVIAKVLKRIYPAERHADEALKAVKEMTGK